MKPMIDPVTGAANPDHWVRRAIGASGGRMTPFGAMLLAILGSTRGRPSLGVAATITPRGDLLSAYIDREGVIQGTRKICTVDEFTGFLSSLAVACDMDDEECNDLFNKARAWISVDLRPGGTDLFGKFDPKKGEFIQ